MFSAYRIDTEFHAIQNSIIIHFYFNHLTKILQQSLFDTISETEQILSNPERPVHKEQSDSLLQVTPAMNPLTRELAITAKRWLTG
jgi:hypothetical protein